jgi:hypothetical protein
MSTLKVDSLVEKTSGNGVHIAGHVVQVVSATKTDRVTSSSQATFVDTGLSATITPTSTDSKILVICSLSAGASSTAGMLGFKVMRGSTGIGLGDASGSEQDVTFVHGIFADQNQSQTTSYNIWDAPATTSATTYKVTFAELNSTSSVSIALNSDWNTGNAYNKRSSSSLTLMEIAQ